MKNLKAITAILILAVVTACETDKINPSSNITIQDRSVMDYTAIKVSTVFEVDVTISDTEEKIEIEANENLHAYIDVYKEGNELIIKVKDKTSITGRATLKAHITTGYPINKITVNEASRLVMNNQLTTDNIQLLADGASYVQAKVTAGSSVVRLEGSARLDISGTADQMNLKIYDAGELNGLDMSVNDVLAEMEGAAQASLEVNETIDLTARDAAVFTYRGNAVITNIDLTDAAEIIKLN